MDSSSSRRRQRLSPLAVRNRLLAFKTIMREPLPPIEWLVEPLIAGASRTIVFGEFACKKSWLLLHLGLHLAAGCPWMGQFPVPKPKSVLYVDEEMSERELRRRIKRLGVGAGLVGQELPFRAVSHSGLRFGPSEAGALLKELEGEGFNPDVVIIETFRRVLVGSENEAEDVSEFWHNVSPILEAGKSLIISHHMRKPSAQGVGDSRYRASGSTDIIAGADCAFAVTRVDGEAITVECVKARAAEESPKFAVSLRDGVGTDEPMVMRFEGQVKESQSDQKELDRASALVGEYMTRAAGTAVRTGDALAYLEEHVVQKRTAERAWYAFVEVYAEKVKQGVYRLKDRPEAAA